MDKPENINDGKWMIWLKKAGIAGFMFFFIKGLVWLFIIFQAGKCALE